MGSLRYISGELISNNSVNNIYNTTTTTTTNNNNINNNNNNNNNNSNNNDNNNNSFETDNRNRYSLLENMKVKDIMNLSNEEKERITRNFSISDSKLFKRENLYQEQEEKLPILSKRIDIESLNNYSEKTRENEFISKSEQGHYLSNNDIDSDTHLDNDNTNYHDSDEKKLDNKDSKKEEISEEERKIREIVNSINCFNKNKNKKKLNKCQSVFSDDRRIKRYDRGHLSGSYSHMVIDVKREEFFKSLRDFNVRMKNISKINHMKSIQQQQKKVFNNKKTKENKRILIFSLKKKYIYIYINIYILYLTKRTFKLYVDY